jgi:heptosyltransferase-2
MKHQGKKNKKILIVKIGAIGDVVMALSMINAIDLKYEGAEITWLCGKKVESLLRNCSRINKIVTLNEKNLLTGNLFIRLSEIVKTWKKLFLRKFDYTVVAYRFSGYKFLTSLTFTGILKDFTGKNRLNTFIPGRYHAVEYARLILEKDNLETTETGFPIINVTSVNVILKQLNHLKGKTIVMNPGGAKNLINGGELRRWPVEHYRNLAIKLIQQHINIILIGSEQDEWVLDHFNNLNVINLIDKTSLIDLLYLFERCDLLLSHDTGVFHLAKLTGIKIIGLFGPVNPAERFGTKENVDIIFLGNTLPCSPCYDGKKFADCDNNVCMKNISVEKVYQMILNKLNSN